MNDLVIYQKHYDLMLYAFPLIFEGFTFQRKEKGE